MPWLADTDVGAAYGVAHSIVGARTETELRRRALEALAELVPADVLTWDRVELATGAIDHEATPAGAEPSGAFEAVVGHAGDHPLLAAHATRRRPALQLSELVEPGVLSRSELYGDLLHAAGVEYEIAIGMRTGRDEAVVAGLGRTERGFSERDRAVLDLARPRLEGALLATQARGRLVRALADDPPPGTAVILLDRDGEIELSSPDARRWLAEHFGTADHPGWLPRPVAEWLALPPRPPLVSERDGRRLTVCLVPGDPHALLLEEAVASFRPDALDRLGLTARESEVLRAATIIDGEAELAWELFLSLHAVRERLAPGGEARGAHGRRRRRPGAPREPVELGRGVRSAGGIVPLITRSVCAVPEFENPSQATPVAEIGPTITAKFKDGPLKGSSIEAEIVEGRPPKTIDAPADDGSTCRYCLAAWVQSGRSAVYTFLYRV